MLGELTRRGCKTVSRAVRTFVNVADKQSISPSSLQSSPSSSSGYFECVCYTSVMVNRPLLMRTEKEIECQLRTQKATALATGRPSDPTRLITVLLSHIGRAVSHFFKDIYIYTRQIRCFAPELTHMPFHPKVKTPNTCPTSFFNSNDPKLRRGGGIPDVSSARLRHWLTQKELARTNGWVGGCCYMV